MFIFTCMIAVNIWAFNIADIQLIVYVAFHLLFTFWSYQLNERIWNKPVTRLWHRLLHFSFKNIITVFHWTVISLFEFFKSCFFSIMEISFLICRSCSSKSLSKLILLSSKILINLTIILNTEFLSKMWITHFSVIFKNLNLIIEWFVKQIYFK